MVLPQADNNVAPRHPERGKGILAHRSDLPLHPHLGDVMLEQNGSHVHDPQEPVGRETVVHVLPHPQLKDATLPLPTSPPAVEEIPRLPPDLRHVEVDGQFPALEQEQNPHAGTGGQQAPKFVESHGIR
ncbi:MAG: hypothetical protein EBU90_30340 [Proteobacteria bacterium]|nr:hypothetical protein [Pseudomonadota bacterium]